MSTETRRSIGWRLHPRVAVREESFGALLYQYATRRLTFVKDRRLAALLKRLPADETVFDELDVPDDDRPRFEAALSRLAAMDMLVADPPADEPADQRAGGSA